MTDKQMLELAALAAGLNAEYEHVGVADGFHIDGVAWNPLTDDGDALRLAVKLKLEFEWWKNGISVSRDDMPPAPIEHAGDDPYTATRRAITRAAAEIGKAMKGQAT